MVQCVVHPHPERTPPAPFPQLLSALSRVDEWTYDMFELNLVSSGRPLSTLAFALLKRSGIVGLLMLDEAKLARWGRGGKGKGARKGGGERGGHEGEAERGSAGVTTYQG